MKSVAICKEKLRAMIRGHGMSTAIIFYARGFILDAVAYIGFLQGIGGWYRQRRYAYAADR